MKWLKQTIRNENPTTRQQVTCELLKKREIEKRAGGKIVRCTDGTRWVKRNGQWYREQII